MEKIKVLLIGLGNIGFQYDRALPFDYVFTHARAFSRHLSFELVAAVDPDKEKCLLFKKEYQCQAYTDLNEALSLPIIDLVVVAVPTESHQLIIQNILQTITPKAILCEKPLGRDISEAKIIKELCHKKGCRLYINYMRRSDPGVIQLKSWIEKQYIKCPVKGVVWYSKGLRNNGSHFVNLLQYWLGKCQSIKINNKGRLWERKDPEPDFEIDFDLGKVYFMSAKEENYSHYTVELVAENGRLNYQQGGRKIEWQATSSCELFPGYNRLQDVVELVENGMKISQWHVANQIANDFSGKHSELCGINEAISTSEILSKIEACS